MGPGDLLDRLRHRPAIVGVLVGVLVMGVLFLLLSPSEVPAAPRLHEDPAAALAAAAPDLPSVPAADPAAPSAPPPVQDSAGTVVPVTPETPPPGEPFPSYNDKSLPMEGYSPPAADPEPVVISQPTGALYQRQVSGSTTTGGFAPVGSLPSDPRVVALIHATFPQAEWSRAERIAGCESGMRSVSSQPNRNGSRDHGIFQLNDAGTLQGLLVATGEDPANVALALDAAWNVKAAKVLWERRGWQPWTCASKLGIVDALWSSTPGPNW